VPSQSVDPRTGEPFGPVIPDTSAAEVRALCDRAAGAAQQWAAMPGAARAAQMRAAADALDAAAEQLVPLADRETGLGLPRLGGELTRTTFTLRLFADAVEDGEHLGVVISPAVDAPPPAGHPDLRRMLLPLGPVAVYGASNFPFAFSVAGGDSASALAAGCPVVAKAHPAHPQLSQAVAHIVASSMEGAGAPSGVFALVHGFEAGKALVLDPAITAAAFTGSGAGGRALFDLAASRPHPIPFYGELGSVNPVFIMAGAAGRETLPTDYLDSVLMGGGQFCTNPSALFVPAGSGLAERIIAASVDREPAVLLNAGVAALFDRHCAELSEIPGVEVVTGSVGGGAGEGFTRAPLLLRTTGAAVLAQPEILHIECFGPEGLLVEYASESEAVALAGVLQGCLAAAVHGEESEAVVPELLAALSAHTGRLIWNGWPTGVAVVAAQNHGGPHPATTNALHTSVGTTAMRRFQRPIAFQSMPAALLPELLRG